MNSPEKRSAFFRAVERGPDSFSEMLVNSFPSSKIDCNACPGRLDICYIVNVGRTMPCLPPMTGNGKHTTYKNGDDWGMVYYCVTLFYHLLATLFSYLQRLSQTSMVDVGSRGIHCKFRFDLLQFHVGTPRGGCI